MATVSTSLKKFADSEVELRPVGGLNAPVGSRRELVTCEFSTHRRRDSTRQLSRVGGEYWRAFDVTTSTNTRLHPTSNASDVWYPTTTTSEGYFRLFPTVSGPADHLRSQRMAITRSIRLYGIVVAACVATVVAVTLAAACIVAHGGSPTTVNWSSWFRRLGRGRSAADLGTASSGGDSDYIYRPLGTGTGNRLDDEYETTFVGVSVPLLQDVRAI